MSQAELIKKICDVEKGLEDLKILVYTNLAKTMN